MKRTQIIELFRNIKSTKVSFFSIMMFVALGIAFFAGLTWTAEGMLHSAHKEVEGAHIYDVEITFPYGFTQDDVDKIAEIDGVDEIEAFRTTCQFVNIKGSNNLIRFNQIGKKMNRFMEVKGKLPKARDELAVEKTYAEKNDIKIGDSISFTCDDGDKMTSLKASKFKVTAIVTSPLYIGRAASTYGFDTNMIAIDGQVFVQAEAFKGDAYSTYKYVDIRNNDLRGLNTYSDEAAESSKKKKKNKLRKTRNQIADGEETIAANRQRPRSWCGKHGSAVRVMS